MIRIAPTIGQAQLIGRTIARSFRRRGGSLLGDLWAKFRKRRAVRIRWPIFAANRNGPTPGDPRGVRSIPGVDAAAGLARQPPRPRPARLRPRSRRLPAPNRDAETAARRYGRRAIGHARHGQRRRNCRSERGSGSQRDHRNRKGNRRWLPSRMAPRSGSTCMCRFARTFAPIAISTPTPGRESIWPRHLEATLRDMERQAQSARGRHGDVALFRRRHAVVKIEPEGIGRIVTDRARVVRSDPNAEVTLEANPNSVDEAYFAGLRAAGVNRLSLGVQTMDRRGSAHPRSSARSLTRKRRFWRRGGPGSTTLVSISSSAGRARRLRVGSAISPRRFRGTADRSIFRFTVSFSNPARPCSKRPPGAF